MSKYIFLALETRDGEREYHHLSVHEAHDDIDIDNFADDYCHDFWGEGEKDKDTNGYWFFGGEICTCVNKVQEIGTLEYQTLKQFL